MLLTSLFDEAESVNISFFADFANNVGMRWEKSAGQAKDIVTIQSNLCLPKFISIKNSKNSSEVQIWLSPENGEMVIVKGSKTGIIESDRKRMTVTIR